MGFYEFHFFLLSYDPIIAKIISSDPIIGIANPAIGIKIIIGISRLIGWDHYKLPHISKYLFEISQYILLPLYSFVRLFVYSFDVILYLFPCFQ